jgi:hypothetical protein
MLNGPAKHNLGQHIHRHIPQRSARAILYRRLLLCLGLIVGTVVLLRACTDERLFAQTLPTLGPGCTFAWDANTETDLNNYKLYLTRDGAQMPAAIIPVPQTSITCQAAGVTTEGTWRANVHAVNKAGQESEPSNGLAFVLALPKPPAAPTRLRTSTSTVAQ